MVHLLTTGMLETWVQVDFLSDCSLQLVSLVLSSPTVKQTVALATVAERINTFMWEGLRGHASTFLSKQILKCR